LTVLVATAVVVVGWGMWLSWRQPPIATASPWSLEPPGRPIEVEPLPPIREEATPAPASLRSAGVLRASGVAAVEVAGTLPPGGSVVVVLDGESLVPLAVRRVTGGDGAEPIELAGIPEGDHRVVVAPDAESARAFYRTRVPLSMVWDQGRLRGAARIDGTAHSVEVELVWDGEVPDGPRPPLVPLLRRADDPRWRHRGSSRHVEFVSGGAFCRFDGLGAGRYDLAFDGIEVLPEDRDKLAFSPPVSGRITIRCRPLP
jgi:hypothetical protein